SAGRRIGLPVCSTMMVLPSLFLAIALPSGLCRLDVLVAATRLQGRDLDAAACGDRARAVLVLQRIEGGAYHVVRVRRPERLGDHVLHAERLEDGAHRAAGDDAGAGRSGAADDLAGAVAAVDVV